MKCPECGHEFGMEDSVPKSMVRKWLNDMIETTEDDDIKIRALSELNKLEQYTGTNLRRDQKKLGVFIVQPSSLLKKSEGPGKTAVEGDGPKSP